MTKPAAHTVKPKTPPPARGAAPPSRPNQPRPLIDDLQALKDQETAEAAEAADAEDAEDATVADAPEPAVDDPDDVDDPADADADADAADDAKNDDDKAQDAAGATADAPADDRYNPDIVAWHRTIHALEHRSRYSHGSEEDKALMKDAAVLLRELLSLTDKPLCFEHPPAPDAPTPTPLPA